MGRNSPRERGSLPPSARRTVAARPRHPRRARLKNTRSPPRWVRSAPRPRRA